MPHQRRDSRRSSNATSPSTPRAEHRESFPSARGHPEGAQVSPRSPPERRRGSRTSSTTSVTQLKDARRPSRASDVENLLRSPRRAAPSIYGPKPMPIFYNSNDFKSADDELPIEVNIAVLGNKAVGKSTFIRKTLDLSPSDTRYARTLTVVGRLCTVEMYELKIEDVYRSEDEALKWPQFLKEKQIHGIMTLYDVGDKSSFRLVPEVLNAINKTSVPSVLAACKCDVPPAQRQLEPRAIEQRASSAFDGITVLQTSEANQEPFRRAISAILSTVISTEEAYGSMSTGLRRCTLPTTSERAPPTESAHSRSTSEMTGIRRKDSERSRHDSSQTTSGTAMAHSIHTRNEAELSQSFLMDESQTEDSTTQSSGSTAETDDTESEHEEPLATPQTPAEDNGWSFDSLVDRLLALPTSKADSKFAAVFLALYRNFAPPGLLLEAIVIRFEALDHREVASMARTVSQLRYLTIVEQWMNLYPGDFAYPKTFGRIKTFIAKLDKKPIFATAAREMAADLELVTDDDDTAWAYCDKDRKRNDTLSTSSPWSYRGSTLIDDPNFEFPDELGSLSLGPRPVSEKSGTSVQSEVASKRSRERSAEFSEKEVHDLVPRPVLSLSKMEWRMLVNTPDEVIARELTRIDWLFFSAIRPRDFVRYVSLSKSQKAQCKSLGNVQRMVDHFNHMRTWVINYVLFRDKPKHRALMLEKFMRIARRLREMNNYNSLGAILAGIDSTPIHRLNSTRELIPPEITKYSMKLQILMSATRSFTTYRLAWENSNSERIPYLPLPVRDLTGAENGNKTFIGPESKGRINWRKFEVMGDVLVGIQRAQGMPYRSAALHTHHRDAVRALIFNTKLVENEDVLFERSQQLENGSNSAGRSFKEFFKR